MWRIPQQRASSKITAMSNLRSAVDRWLARLWARRHLLRHEHDFLHHFRCPRIPYIFRICLHACSSNIGGGVGVRAWFCRGGTVVAFCRRAAYNPPLAPSPSTTLSEGLEGTTGRTGAVTGDPLYSGAAFETKARLAGTGREVVDEDEDAGGGGF
jgi:hypothetical protein